MKVPLIQSQIVMILLFHHFMLDEFKLYKITFITHPICSLTNMIQSIGLLLF